MRKVKFVITILAIIFSIATLKGQDNMVINLVGSSNVTIAIDDIQRITFDKGNMLLKTVNGAENTYLLDDITSITFLDDPSAIQDTPKNIELNVYVNAYGEIVVESPYRINRLTVFDLSGKQLTTSAQSNLNVSFLSTGMYLLRVETTEGTVTKKFIKN